MKLAGSPEGKQSFLRGGQANVFKTMKFAVVQTGGKQYKVREGEKVKIEKLNAEVGGEVLFDKVLLAGEGGEVKIGKPYVSGASVEAKILSQGRADKKIVFKYQSKTRRKKKKGHRQAFTEVQITKINE